MVEQRTENPRVPGSIPGGAIFIFDIRDTKMMGTLVLTIHIFIALFLILVVLVQGGNSGGVGAAFGGGNSSGVFGATGATSLLGKLTYGAAFVFMVTSISLTMMQSQVGKTGLGDRIEMQTTTQPDESLLPQLPAAEEDLD